MKTVGLNGDAVVDAAFKAFNEWREKNDPDGHMDILEQANAYFEEWLATQQSTAGS